MKRPASKRGALSAVVALVLFGLLLAGCQEKASPVATNKAASLPAPNETWDVLYIGDAKVGFAHTTVKPSGEGDEAQVEITSTNELSSQRGRDTNTVRMIVRSVEKLAGTPLSFARTQDAAGSEESASGEWADGKLIIS